jgi:hypothetical protein
VAEHAAMADVKGPMVYDALGGRTGLSPTAPPPTTPGIIQPYG